MLPSPQEDCASSYLAWRGCKGARRHSCVRCQFVFQFSCSCSAACTNSPNCAQDSLKGEGASSAIGTGCVVPSSSQCFSEAERTSSHAQPRTRCQFSPIRMSAPLHAPRQNAHSADILAYAPHGTGHSEPRATISENTSSNPINMHTSKINSRMQTLIFDSKTEPRSGYKK